MHSFRGFFPILLYVYAGVFVLISIYALYQTKKEWENENRKRKNNYNKNKEK